MQGSISDCLCIKTWNTCPVCQGFITVKVASKWDMPLTWLKYISCIPVVCNFLVATYECAWTGSGLAVFSVCWCLILSFLAISQHLRETELTYGTSLALQRVSRSTGTLASALPTGSVTTMRRGRSKWHVETQNAQISTASPATCYSQVTAL